MTKGYLQFFGKLPISFYFKFFIQERIKNRVYEQNFKIYLVMACKILYNTSCVKNGEEAIW